jgi:hypothetical protein
VAVVPDGEERRNGWALAPGALVVVIVSTGLALLSHYGTWTMGGLIKERVEAHWWGHRGTVVIASCERSSGDGGPLCRGRFVSDDEKVDIDPISVGLPAGSSYARRDARVPAEVSGPDADKAFASHDSVWLYVLLLGPLAVLVAVVGVGFWVPPGWVLWQVGAAVRGRVRGAR